MILKKRKKDEIVFPKYDESEIAEVRDFVLQSWEMGDTHGLSHWQRVERNGLLLSMQDGEFRSDVCIKVVRYFAYLHDSCRENDGGDIEHGVRAANMLHKIRHTILKDFNDEEFALLETACRLHTTKHRTGNITVDICFDADRLDLGRVGLVPNPKLMATSMGAHYAPYFGQ